MTDLHVDLGPKMRALKTDEQRNFVIAYVRNGGNAVQACKTAGYAASKMHGWRLLQRTDIQDAMRELCETDLKGLTPSALMGMRKILDDPNHKDHARTIFAVLDRTGMHAVNEVRTTVQVDDKHLASAIKTLAAELGFDPQHARRLSDFSKVIEGETIEGDGSDGLEDLLS